MSENLSPLLEKQPYAAVLRQVGEEAARLGVAAYAVGGVVRDALLGRKTTDVDFVTVGAGTGILLAKAVGQRLGGRAVHVYKNFGTAAIRLPASKAGEEALVLEFVAARRESYRRDSRKPRVEDGTLDDDQRRRDFTINTMALALAPHCFGDLLDPFGGRADLAQARIRTPLEPRRTFADDPLRMIRAARFATQLGFTIDPAARAAMKAQAQRLEILSGERIIDEVQKIIIAPTPSVGFKLLEEAGLLERFFPELVALKGVEEVAGQRHKDNFYHTLQVVDNLAAMTTHRDVETTRWLRWAALLHDIAKPLTKRFVEGTGWTFHGHEDRGARIVPKLFRRLKLPMDERMAYVQKLVRLHHRPVALVDDVVTDSAVRRLLFDAGDAIDDLMTLVRADITSKNLRRVQRYLAAFDRVEHKFVEVEEKDRLRNFQPPVNGLEIMAVLGIGEGVAVGIIKDAIREAILDGEIANEHDAAFAHMMQIKDEALRRGALFDEVMGLLQGPERRATGAIKQEIFTGPVPQDHDAALNYLLAIKDKVLAEV